MIYIFDKNEHLQAIFKPEGNDNSIAGSEYAQTAAMFIGGEEKGETRYGSCPYWNAVHTEDLRSKHDFVFTVPGNHPDSEFVKAGSLIAFRDLDGDFQLFEIINPEQEYGESNIITAYCQHASLELLDDPQIDELNITNMSAHFALTQALNGTRWEVGRVDDFGANTILLHRKNPLAAVVEIANTWKGELRYRTEIVDNKITNRYVDLVSQRGLNRAKRFEYGKDIEEIIYTEDLTKVKTALYGYGKSEEIGQSATRITFENVEWSVDNGDPTNKPLGQSWVGDNVAREQFGRPNPDGSKRHRFGQFDDAEESDPAALLQKTWNELQEERKNIPMTWQMKVITLEELTDQFGNKFDHEKVRLGDTVYVINRDFVPALVVEARVILIKRYLGEPERTEVILGNFFPLFTDDERLDRIEQRINDRSGIWDDKLNAGGPINTSWLDGVIDVLQNKINAAESNWYTDDDGNLIFEALDGNSAMKLAGSGFAIANTKDENERWNWRTFGTGDGFTADEIRAGTLRGERIAAGEITSGHITTDGLDASIIKTGTLDADRIGANTIDANKLNVNTLSAISGNLGTVTAGSITSNTTINVGTNVTIGNNIYLGEQQTLTNHKFIHFNNSSYIRGHSDILVHGHTNAFISSSSSIQFSSGNIFSNGHHIFLRDIWLSSSDGTANLDTVQSFTVSTNTLRGRSNANVINLGTSGCSVDMASSNARWRRTANDYIMQSSSSVNFFFGGTARHRFDSDGSKSGGTIENNGKIYGMSPVDSPRVLIKDMLFHREIDGERTFELEPTLADIITRYDVVSTNPDIKIVEVNRRSFKVKGHGRTSFMIIGLRRSYEDVYWMSVDSLTKEQKESEIADGD